MTMSTLSRSNSKIRLACLLPNNSAGVGRQRAAWADPESAVADVEFVCRIGQLGAAKDSRGKPTVQAVDRLEHMMEMRMAQVSIDQGHRSPGLSEHHSQVGCDSRLPSSSLALVTNTTAPC